MAMKIARAIKNFGGVMLIRKLAAISVELLVLAIGVALAAPYFLVLASPFIGH